jgi:hypothetical protein
VRQDINGFSLRRKRMRVQRVTLMAEPDLPLPPRYFVLCFRIYDFNEPLRQGMDYFFQHILRAQDQLLVFVNERTMLLDRPAGPGQRRELLEQVLRGEAAGARKELEAYFLRVQKDIDQNRLRLLIEGSGQSFAVPQIIRFLETYLQVWQGFKKKYLVPDLDKFYNFAHYLQKINGEKWILNFYQVEVFPKMKISGSIRNQLDELIGRLVNEGGAAEQFARVIRRSLAEIEREFSSAGDFPAEQIGKMLIGVDTTYLCFIGGLARAGMSDDLEYARVASDLENSLREITKNSGGEVVSSSDIGSALHEIEEKEDAYYVLTYEPQHRGPPGRVKIELDDPRCRLVYDDRVRTDYIASYLEKKQVEDPTLQLDRISLSHSRLQLEISSFKMAESKAKKSGQLYVAITVRDGSDRTLYEQGRALTAHEAKVSLAVDFSFLGPGRYYFLVEVRDGLTGRTAMDILQADVR